MTVSDIKDQLSLFTDYELEKIIDEIAKEKSKRLFARRRELTETFIEAWNALANEGVEIYLEGEPVLLEDIDFI